MKNKKKVVRTLCVAAQAVLLLLSLAALRRKA